MNILNFKKIAIVLLLPVFISCGGSEVEKDMQVFRFNQNKGIQTLDPGQARTQSIIWAVNQLYSGLVQFDPNLNIVPSIAHSWEVSDDGLTYTFHLRDDVYFHDNPCFESGKGRKVTASDIVYSFDRLIDPEAALAGSWVFNDKVRKEKPFVAENDTIFILHLERPFRPLLGILTMQYCSVIPPEAISYYGNEFRRNPVGTGPFQLKEWNEMESMIMERNPNYYETWEGKQLPLLDEVVISFIGNKSTEFLAFLDGELEFVSDIDPGLKDLVLTLEGELAQKYQERIELLRSPYLNLEYFGFVVNPENEELRSSPIMDVKVRQAINYAFSRQNLIRFLRNNKGIPATEGVIPPGLPSYDQNAGYGYEYNPEKAKQLLKEAGYPDGNGLPPIALKAPAEYMDLGEFLQQELNEMGILLNLENVQSGILRGEMEDGTAGFFRGSWIADYPDAESYLAMFYSGYTAPPNYTRFDNPAFDSLYLMAVQENNDPARHNLYHNMDSIVMSHAPIVPLYYDEVYRFVNKNVKGMNVNPMNLLNLKRVWIEDE